MSKLNKKMEVAVTILPSEAVILDSKGNVYRLEDTKEGYYYKEEDMFYSTVTSFLYDKFGEGTKIALLEDSEENELATIKLR